MTAVRRVCVCWPHLLPYHDARLRVLDSFLAEAGAELTSLETAAPAPSVDRSYPHVTVFPRRSFETIPGPEMQRGATAALDRLDPDAVAITSYSTPDSRAALAWCRRRRRVAVMMFDSRHEDTERSAWREWAKRQLVGLFDAALVGGTPHVAYAVELGIPRSHVFTPVDVVDNRHFASGDAGAGRLILGLDRPFFLAANRFIPRKGLGVLLDAYQRYRSTAAAPWDLVLAGNGPERVSLERSAGPGVSFPGFLQYPDLPSVYAAASAFIHPAMADQWGLVVNEAMAAGLPVVVSRGAGCAPDLVDEGRNGYTVPAGEPDALADRMTRVAGLSEVERTMMATCSRDIIARYDLAAFAEGLWSAVQAGRGRANRGPTPGGTLVLRVLEVLARRSTSLHAIPS